MSPFPTLLWPHFDYVGRSLCGTGQASPGRGYHWHREGPPRRGRLPVQGVVARWLSPDSRSGKISCYFVFFPFNCVGYSLDTPLLWSSCYCWWVYFLLRWVFNRILQNTKFTNFFLIKSFPWGECGTTVQCSREGYIFYRAVLYLHGRNRCIASIVPLLYFIGLVPPYVNFLLFKYKSIYPCGPLFYLFQSDRITPRYRWKPVCAVCTCALAREATFYILVVNFKAESGQSVTKIQLMRTN